MTFFEKNLGGKGEKGGTKTFGHLLFFPSWRFLINGPSLKFSFVGGETANLSFQSHFSFRDLQCFVGRK